jgi:FkbM family methyltransferase
MAITQLIRGHTILPRLDSSSVVLDCGANRGEFATHVSQKFGSKVFSLEPNPELVKTFPAVKNVTLLPYALADQDGTMTLNVGVNCEASSLITTAAGGSTGSVEVQVRSLATLLKELQVSRVALLKLDIEGAEIGVILKSSDELLQACDQLTIEFHDMIGYTPVEQVKQAIDRLERLGFRACRQTYNGHGDMLFVNTKTIPFSSFQQFWVSQIEKHARKLKLLN